LLIPFSCIHALVGVLTNPLLLLWSSFSAAVISLGDRTRGGWIITAIGLFSLLSFPSGVLISIRTQYREMLDDKEEKRTQAQQAKAQPAQARHESKPKPASAYKDRMREMLEAEYAKTARVLSPKEITAALKLDHNNSKGFVSTTTSAWMQEKGISKGGKGLTF